MPVSSVKITAKEEDKVYTFGFVLEQVTKLRHSLLEKAGYITTIHFNEALYNALKKNLETRSPTILKELTNHSTLFGCHVLVMDSKEDLVIYYYTN